MPRPISSLVPILAAAVLLVGGNGDAGPVAGAQERAEAAIPQPQAASLTVTADAVRRQVLAETISGTGTVVAWQEASVGATSGGLALIEVLVAEGQRVEKDAVLARLDSAMIEAEIGQQQAAIRSAEASYAAALSANERARRLSTSGSVSAETAEERQTAVQTAEAALAQAKAALATLHVQLDRTVIRAPFAGIVSAEPATVGITVQAGTELMKVQRDGALRAAIDIPEQYLARMSAGDGAEVFGPSGETLTGRIASIAETVDAATHLGRVEIELPQGSRLKAGMFVRAAISVGGGEEEMTVAEASLTWRDGKTAVFVLADGNRVLLKPVEAGTRRDGRIAVVGDIREGERVVTSGAGFLNDGNTVRVVADEATATGSIR